MVPWETLRRLLGLPADTEPPSSAELVRFAIAEPRHARLIAMALRGRVPKEGPAAMLLTALDRGTLSNARVAELLGCVGHPAGYGAVVAMLYAEDADAFDVAGVAAARMIGRRADADLAIALSAAPERRGREGAAFGLCEIGSPDAADSVAQAGLEGRVRMRVATRCLVRMPFDAEFWIEQLESPEVRPRRYGTELVYALLTSSADESDERLAALGERGRAAVARALEDTTLYMLPDKREALERWLSAHAS